MQLTYLKMEFTDVIRKFTLKAVRRYKIDTFPICPCFSMLRGYFYSTALKWTLKLYFYVFSNKKLEVT